MSYPDERHDLPASHIAAQEEHASSEAEAVNIAGRRAGEALAASANSIGSDLAEYLADQLGCYGADLIDQHWTHVEADQRPGRFFAIGLSDAFELMTKGKTA